MKTKALTLVALCLSLSTNAWAITAGEACNSATDTNTCENGTLFICPSQDYPNEGATQNEWYAYDCGSRYAGTTCGTIGTIDTCVASSGQQCLFQEEIIQDQSGDNISTSAGDYQFMPCGDTGTGCDAFVSGTCKNINACTPPAEGETFEPVCVGNNAVWGCYQNGTPVFDDCAEVGGTCEQGLYCTDVAKGGKCDGDGSAQSGGPYWTCDADTKCFGYGEQSAPGYYLNEKGRCIPDRDTCGNVTYFGECLGTVALFCGDADNDPDADLVAYQCGDLNGDGEAMGACHVFDELGAFCTFREGETCVIEMEANGQSGPRTFACYEADNPNKELFCNLDTGLCELSQAACPEDADYVCDGDRLNSCGEIAISWDCTSDDILATGCNNGACIGIPEDEACNPPAFLCADGYFCDSDTNTCQEGEAPSAPDAGVLPTENTDGGPSIDDADAGNNETLQADAGTADGATDGTANGTDDGTSDGTADGVTDGSADGATDGSADGTNDGTTDGMTDGTTDGVSIDAGVEEDINLGTRADPPGMTAAETGCGCHSQHQNRNPLGLLLSLIFVLPMALRRKNA